MGFPALEFLLDGGGKSGSRHAAEPLDPVEGKEDLFLQCGVATGPKRKSCLEAAFEVGIPQLAVVPGLGEQRQVFQEHDK